jgi:hypothetical protein
MRVLQPEVKPIPQVNSGAVKTPVPSLEVLDLQRRLINLSTQKSEGANELALEVLVEGIKLFPNHWSNSDRSANHYFAGDSQSRFPPGCAA